MSIPGATSVPGAELVLRAPSLAPGPDVPVVVNCAGRTRSIIGAQSLINAGVPNPVAALRNGTIGWVLAGQVLDRGREREAPLPPSADVAVARARARRVAERCGVGRVAPAALAELLADPTRTTYRFDVRTPAEHHAGHPPGFEPAPGGQLVQEVDVFAPVRGARVVLYDDLGVRADMTASWLAQMGWEVLVLEAEPGDTAAAALPPGPSWVPALPDVPVVSPAELACAATTLQVVDVASSRSYRQGHVPGAVWATRADLAAALARGGLDPARVVLASEHGVQARVVAAEVAGAGRGAPRVLEGGTAAWAAGAGELESAEGTWWSEPVDVYRRPYEGVGASPQAMQAYLDWEHGLVEQLGRDGTHRFWVLTGHPAGTSAAMLT